jgi:hypothetical protein
LVDVCRHGEQLVKEASAARPNGFAFLMRKEIPHRLRSPIGQTGFWLYLVLAVLVLGGLAIYIEGLRYFRGPPGADARGLELALYTVFPAVMGSSSVQLALDKENSPTRNAGIATLVLCFFLAYYLITNIGLMSDWISILIGGLACAFSVFVWWVANGSEPIFQDQIRPDASIGGDIDTPLNGGPGDVQI